jgi:3-oxoacyl-[acyl-carrier protein] reductase
MDRVSQSVIFKFCFNFAKYKNKPKWLCILISSHTIKNPEDQLVLSNCYRLAACSLLKTYSNINAKNNISCINIAPGPIKTNRLKNLVKDLKKFEKNLPMLRAGDPEEIGNFVNSIFVNNIKYLNGVTINFDGGLSKSIF